MITMNKKGAQNRHMFEITKGVYKIFPCNTKKEKRRVKKFRKQYYECNTWYDKD